jgi:hypothetical protein
MAPTLNATRSASRATPRGTFDEDIALLGRSRRAARRETVIYELIYCARSILYAL